MKWFLFGLLVLGLALAEDSSEEVETGLPLAEPCDVEACKLPNCRCSSTQIPGGLAARDTPQFVLLTFDDNINIINIETYRDILYRRRNSNNCPAGTTFYVSHEYTNYQLVNELYNNDFEIALHSITHVTNTTYWAQATKEDMMREFGDQTVLISHFANIPSEHFKGVRIPFLQMTGNASFEMKSDVGLVYDASWPTNAFINPGLWPYTLDYASTQDCIVPPCPTASIPGVWVLPIISFVDLAGWPCSFADACFSPPNLQDEEAWYRFILTNFERQYRGNRAPFGFYIHEWFIAVNPAVRRALVRFLNLVNTLPDAFMVNSIDVIEWTKNPVPVDEYVKQPCRTNPPAQCPTASCGPLSSDHTQNQFWMQICNVCPARYPWLGNPLGQQIGRQNLQNLNK